ncbi:MAG TPA: YgiT-type zinc finger protein [Polyangiaceae bacterium]|nr:YgiT-type zinc finger protein [Polyangiaceae bacterium]
MKASSSTRKARSAATRVRSTSTSSSRQSVPSRREATLFVRCPTCGSGPMALRKVDKTYAVRRRKVQLRELPMRICAACGARFLDGETATFVERALGITRRRSKRPAA